jgi:hypothetical protein
VPLTCTNEDPKDHGVDHGNRYIVVTLGEEDGIMAATRKRPSGVIQADILEDQGNRCLYCGLEFGYAVWRRIYGTVWLEVHWDHRVPYSYLQTNPDSNWIAACQLCNGYKSSLMFATLEEIRSYIVRRARSHHHDPMPLWDYRGNFDPTPVIPARPLEDEITEEIDEIEAEVWLADDNENEVEYIPTPIIRRKVKTTVKTDFVTVEEWIRIHRKDINIDSAGVDAWLALHGEQRGRK